MVATVALVAAAVALGVVTVHRVDRVEADRTAAHTLALPVALVVVTEFRQTAALEPVEVLAAVVAVAVAAMFWLLGKEKK